MKEKLENKKKAIRYLYGELAAAERDGFEERLFADEGFSLFLDDVENDLIDEYIRGELEFEKKRKFESKYLTSDSRYERVALARTLQNELFKEETVVSATENPNNWKSITGFFRVPNLALAGGFAVILLLILLGGFWILNQSDKSENIAGADDSNQQENTRLTQKTPLPEITPESEDLSTDEKQLNINNSSENKNDSIDANTRQTPEPKNTDSNKIEKKPIQKPVREKPKTDEKPKTIQPPPRVFAFSLMPPLRSSETPVLKIPPSAETVRLRLFDNFGRVYEKFLIELNGSSGDTIWSRQITASKKRPQRLIVVSIPNKQFKSGNYEIAVSGITKKGSVEEINFYNFVVKKDKD